jgi:hypothetical protein
MYYTQDSAYDSYSHEYIKYCMHTAFALAHLAVVVIIIIISSSDGAGVNVMVCVCMSMWLHGMILVSL